jgi:hypothetical protein
MIGGIVTRTVVLKDRVWVDCVERSSNSKCAVYCERNSDSEAIRPGDSFWWQAGKCMWTPFDKSRVDVKIKKLGYSGVGLPKEKNETQIHK